MKGRIWKSLIGVSAVAVLAVAGVTSYTVVRYLRTTPRFDVKKVSVVGIKRVEDTQVYAQAGLRGSGNIFSADLDAIRERVEGLRWVRFATVQRVLPDTISIKVVEREPVGLARIRGEIYQFDAQSELLDPDTEGGSISPYWTDLNSMNLRQTRKRSISTSRSWKNCMVRVNSPKST